MLFQSNKFFYLKRKKKKKKSENSYPKNDINENMCDHTVKYWQLSINLCQFYNFLLHVAVKAITLCKNQVHNCAGSAIPGIPQPKF